jgi:hypothetical protein
MRGEVYLFNLSLLALTFTAVSALVMLMRQTMGGKLSNFDVYLIATYTSLGFVVAFDAILPSLVDLYEPRPALLWAISSGVAAILLAAVMANVLRARARATHERLSRPLVVIFGIHWFDVFLLAVNATIPTVQGSGLFATALTLSFGVLLVAFVRRIGSLLGEKPGEDWDPKRG